MHSIPGRPRNVYEVTLTLGGLSVWTSPLVFGDTEKDAKLIAQALYRVGTGLEDNPFGYIPGVDGSAVRLVRASLAKGS
jgi:hypothetical protein